MKNFVLHVIHIEIIKKKLTAKLVVNSRPFFRMNFIPTRFYFINGVTIWTAEIHIIKNEINRVDTEPRIYR